MKFFDYLKNEQLKSTELYTVGGHSLREMNYAFLNYRGNTILNPMDNSDEMQMNCDYYLGTKIEGPCGSQLTSQRAPQGRFSRGGSTIDRCVGVTLFSDQYIARWSLRSGGRFALLDRFPIAR